MLAYTEFDTTQVNLLADLRTAILASTDWSRPNAGGKPDLYKCTTTRGAVMCFDLSDSAISITNLNIGVWRDHDGTTGIDKTQRYLYWRSITSGFANTNPLHCIVSVGKEHIYISIEGPRANEPGASSTTGGSMRNYFFMSDLVPYHASDTTPVVYAGGAMAGSPMGSFANNSHLGHLSRNFGNSSSWMQTKLLQLGFPTIASQSEIVQPQRLAAGDGKYYLSPYVAFDDSSGLRGRLSSFFHAGYNWTDSADHIPPPPVGSKISYGGETYKLLAVNKGDNTSMWAWGQFGAVYNYQALYFRSPVVAVPCTP